MSAVMLPIAGCSAAQKQQTGFCYLMRVAPEGKGLQAAMGKSTTGIASI